MAPLYHLAKKWLHIGMFITTTTTKTTTTKPFCHQDIGPYQCHALLLQYAKSSNASKHVIKLFFKNKNNSIYD